MFIDIDNFKEVNDRFGHKVGDTLLVTVSKIFAIPPAARRSARRIVAITTEGSGFTAIMAIQNPPAAPSTIRLWCSQVSGFCA